MKKTIIITITLFFAMLALSFADEPKKPDPNVSAYGHANENAKFKRNQVLLNNKANVENRAKRTTTQVKKKTEVSKAKAQVSSVNKRSQGNVKVEKSGNLFNNKANKEIRAEIAQKDKAQAKKKAEKDEDKGEGQVKMKF